MQNPKCTKKRSRPRWSSRRPRRPRRAPLPRRGQTGRRQNPSQGTRMTLRRRPTTATLWTRSKVGVRCKAEGEGMSRGKSRRARKKGEGGSSMKRSSVVDNRTRSGRQPRLPQVPGSEQQRDRAALPQQGTRPRNECATRLRGRRGTPLRDTTATRRSGATPNAAVQTTNLKSRRQLPLSSPSRARRSPRTQSTPAAVRAATQAGTRRAQLITQKTRPSVIF